MIPASTGLTDEQRSKLDDEGYVLLHGVLSPTECDEIAAAMDRAHALGERSDAFDTESGVQFVENPLRYTSLVQSCVLNPLVLDAARTVVGDRAVLNLINGRSPGAGAAGQPLHDLSRRRGRPFDKCNAIWCLDEFTAENGATRVLPGSHLDDHRAVSRMGDPLDPHPDEVLVEAPRGSVVFHNSHLIHSGRPNRSDRPRRSIHAAYSRPEMPTHYDWNELPRSVVAELGRPMLQLLGLADPGALVLG